MAQITVSKIERKKWKCQFPNQKQVFLQSPFAYPVPQRRHSKAERQFTFFYTQDLQEHIVDKTNT